MSGAYSYSRSAETDMTETILAQGPNARLASPFVRWHLRGKFHVMEELFRRYLAPNAKFVDIGCGIGDGLVLAALCQPKCEIWGLDIDRASLDIARRRTPNAILLEGDMHDPNILPRGHFDVVHEVGATFLSRRWDVLAKVYFSLLRDGGVLLWELPQRWSTAHISYLLSVAPKITAADTKIRRIFRTFSPFKYHFESDQAVLRALQTTGFDYEIVEKIGIWHFYCRGVPCKILDWAWRFGGDGLFDWFDKVTGRIWPRYAGYYLAIRKKAQIRNP